VRPITLANKLLPAVVVDVPDDDDAVTVPLEVVKLVVVLLVAPLPFAVAVVATTADADAAAATSAWAASCLAKQGDDSIATLPALLSEFSAEIASKSFSRSVELSPNKGEACTLA